MTRACTAHSAAAPVSSSRRSSTAESFRSPKVCWIRFTAVASQTFRTGPVAHNVGLVFNDQSGQTTLANAMLDIQDGAEIVWEADRSLTSFSITGDGARFLRIQPVNQEPAIRRIELVIDWFSALQRGGSAR